MHFSDEYDIYYLTDKIKIYRHYNRLNTSLHYILNYYSKYGEYHTLNRITYCQLLLIN